MTTIARHHHDSSATLSVPGRILLPLARSIVTRRLSSLRQSCLHLSEPSRLAPLTLGNPQAPDHFAIRVHSLAFFTSLAFGGSLGAADSFIRGEWSCDDLPGLLGAFVREIDPADRLEKRFAAPAALIRAVAHRLARNTRTGSARNIHEHYDLGNDFFRLMLDETMMYSCAFFPHPDASLRDASIEKNERLCRLVDLRPDDHLLEIGTGWGGFAIHAASVHRCRVTTTTISREQFLLAAKRIADAKLQHRVTLLEQDYRDLTGTCDKLISIEMIEAVGHEFLPAYFRACRDRLRAGGLMALQVIIMPDDRYDQYLRSTDFIRTHVFPGGCCPSMAAIRAALPDDLLIDHVEDITPHYVTTLRHWRRNFRANLARIRAMGYSDSFIRLWEFYLAYCEAGFAGSYTRDLQIRLRRTGA